MAVVATGVQAFEHRFPGKLRRFDQDLPPIAPWRCNLTGLSQAHNLYFVAYGKDIYVYVPRFPTQAVPPQPTLIFTSQPSAADLTGHIDQGDPHAINNLVVQELGREEVVAVVRDDGDVDAFLLRHIVQAIARRAEAGNSIGLVGDEVKPIFQSNVGESAWGLAIHAEARIIAVSSNAHEVSIFKFALLDEFDDADDEQQEHHRSDSDPFIHSESDYTDDISPILYEVLVPESTGEAPGRQRRTDVIHQVLNGNTNIPHIAFCNTGDDPDARWLLTTDIAGVCRVMDLLKLQPVQAFRFGPRMPSSYGLGEGFDRFNAGWGIMFLDRRSFFAADSVHEALGLDADEAVAKQLPDVENNSVIWDLSKTMNSLPQSSSVFTHHKQEPTPERRRASRRSSSRALRSGRETQAINDNEPLADGAIGESSASPDESASDSPDEPNGPEMIIDDDDDLEDEGTEDSVSFTSVYGGKRICGNLPQFVRQTDVCEHLPCPILHTSVRNIYLLQPSSQRHYQSPFAPPMLGFAHALRQSVQYEYRALNMFERLNMHAYIPDLGIVVLASQKGRALVLALTKLGPAGAYPAAMLRDFGSKTTYAMKAVAVLPFASQETANLRQPTPLQGIAVGPVQGTEAHPQGKKRWRLLMLYQDHSLFSYEICRPQSRAGEIDDVIV